MKPKTIVRAESLAAGARRASTHLSCQSLDCGDPLGAPLDRDPVGCQRVSDTYRARSYKLRGRTWNVRPWPRWNPTEG